MCLTVDDIHKKHNRELVVAKNISFTIKKGELGALIGPSGCGKTTLLRMIAGFETPDQGTISINGQQVSGTGINISAEHRGTGMVFQDYALFPHLSVIENIGFGPAKRKKSDLDKLISLTGLTGSENKYPHELSGGQQQRVALARALAPKPALLLMDHKSDTRALLVKSHFRGPGRRHTFELSSGEQFICTDNYPSPLELGKWYGISICNRRVSLFYSNPIH